MLASSEKGLISMVDVRKTTIRLSHLICPLAVILLSVACGLRSMSGIAPGNQYQYIKQTSFARISRDEGGGSVSFSNAPLYYRDRAGRWSKIDTRLEAAGKEMDLDGRRFAYKVTKNTFASYFPRNGQGWVELKSGAHSFSFRLLGATDSAFARKPNGVRAANVFKDCDMDLTVGRGMLKEELILNKRQNDPSFTYQISLDGLTAKKTAEGRINLSNVRGKQVFYIERFVMYDAKGEASRNIQVDLTRQGRFYYLRMKPDRKWLNDPKRAYPIVVDPTTYNIVMDGDNSAGAHNTYYMYIPCLNPTQTNLSFGGLGDNQSHYINHLEDVHIFSYKIRVKYTISFGDDATFEDCKELPYLKIFICENNSGTWVEQVTPVVTQQFRDGTSSGWFEIDSGYCAKIVVDTGRTTDVSGAEGYWCSLAISYQNENCSPPPPLLTLLPPETYGTTVRLNWTAPSDEANPGVPASGIAKYHIQRSTDPLFSSYVVTAITDTAVNSFEITGLSLGTTYYFRVYAQDVDDNPLNINPWDPEINPSGVRWSEITRTKCVAAPPQGSPAKPAIANLTSDAGKPVNIIGDERFTAERNPRVHWSGSSPVGMPFLSVDAGGYYTLGVTGDHVARSWGSNANWQLGIGESLPGQVKRSDGNGFLTNVIAVNGVYYHSLALKSDGTVWAWGLNNFGQLGNGTTTNATTPVQVNGLTGTIAVSGGYGHSLALKNDGTVWAWGYNNSGQLGNGTTTNATAPVQVNGLTDVIAVSGGYYHSLALKSDGTVWAWGRNDGGQLGNGTTTNATTPVQINGLTGAIAVSGGAYHSLALKSDGTVWAWGHNSSGQLGNGTTTNATTPVQVNGLIGAIAVSGGHGHSLAVKSDGTVWAWGYNNCGQLGNGTTTNATTPVQVSGLTGAIAVSGGWYCHSLALKSDGTVWAWGYNFNGQLGNGTTTNATTPVQVNGLTGAIAVSGGYGHSLALKNDGTVWAWGYNFYGQLATGPTTNATTPVQVKGLTDVIAVSSGAYHSLALKNDGTVWAWGNNSYGQLGNGTTTNATIRVQVNGLTGVIAVSGGFNHSLALKSDGTVWAWGYNGCGQLGNGTTTHATTPVQVNGLTGVIAVSGGNNHSLALKSDGTVWAWGYNNLGQLGNGTTTSATTPVQVSGLTGAIAVSGGWYCHSLALKSDGTVWAWGYNFNGQLGNGTTTNATTPVQVNGLTGAIAVSGGNNHSLAVKSDGTVWAWGYNYYGQLGNGTTTYATTPVQVNGLTGAIAVSGGFYHSLAVKSDGTVWAWGQNNYGQLGDGTTQNSSYPVATQMPYFTSSQQQVQISVTEILSEPKIPIEYPAITINTTDTSGPTNWNLPDGRYVVHVRVANNVSWSEWSAGKRIIIDTVPPVIQAHNDTPTTSSVDLHLTSNEPIRYDLYWGDNPNNLSLNRSIVDYCVYDQTTINIPDSNLAQRPHYYKFICRDKAGNVSMAGTYCVTQITRLAASAGVENLEARHRVDIEVIAVPWAASYKYYRKNPDSTIECLTLAGTGSTYQDNTVVPHGVYEYAYTVVDAAGRESAKQWADARTIIDHAQLAPKVYIPNIPPDVTVTKQGDTNTTNPTLHFTLGAARDEEGDQLLYSAYYKATGTGQWILSGRWKPADGGMAVTVRLPGPGTYKWRFMCIEAESSIIDRREILVDSDNVTVNAIPEEQIESDTEISGIWHIDRIIIVMPDVTLTIMPGTKIIADPGCGLIVRGTLYCAGQALHPVSFSLNPSGTLPGDTWLGIRFEDAGTGTFTMTFIIGADRGVACVGAGSVLLKYVRFNNNIIGLHCYAGTITVDHCQFNLNTLYGIKEDNGCNPTVKYCDFRDNGMPYYDWELTEVTEDELNTLNTGANVGNDFH